MKKKTGSALGGRRSRWNTRSSFLLCCRWSWPLVLAVAPPRWGRRGRSWSRSDRSAEPVRSADRGSRCRPMARRFAPIAGVRSGWLSQPPRPGRCHLWFCHRWWRLWPAVGVVITALADTATTAGARPDQSGYRYQFTGPGGTTGGLMATTAGVHLGRLACRCRSTGSATVKARERSSRAFFLFSVFLSVLFLLFLWPAYKMTLWKKQ